LKEDCEIANKRLEATAAELKRWRQTWNGLRRKRNWCFASSIKPGSYDYYETCFFLMFN
jgi:hypothetical protein